MNPEVKDKEPKSTYQKESDVSKQFEEMLENIDSMSQEDIKSQLQGFSKNYKRLVQEVKLLTSVGDRLQKKVKSANQMLQEQSDEIQKINKDLQDKNIELQFTIDELTKAKAGRRATTIIFIFAIVLFGVTEFLEWAFESFFTGGNLIIIYAFKMFLVIGFKPIEGLLESTIISREMRLQRAEMDKQGDDAPIVTSKIQIPIIELKTPVENKETEVTQKTEIVEEAEPKKELTAEEIAKLERKAKREAMKKMGENRE